MLKLSYIPNLVNMTLRGITLLSKFALVFLMAKYLPAEDLGLFGLLSVTVGIFVYIVGSDYYMYANRELMRGGLNDLPQILLNQGAFYLISYTLVIPLSGLLFVFGLLEKDVMAMFMFLFILSHITIELYRVIVSAQHQLLGTLMLFFSGGAWCCFCMVVLFWDASLFSLELILYAWCVGLFFACFIGFVWVLKNTRGEASVDLKWIKAGIRVAVPFLLATLAVRGLFTADQYLVEGLADREVLGAYVLFIGIANAMVSFVDSGVIVFFQPKVVKFASDGNQVLFSKAMYTLFLGVVLGGFVFSVLGVLTGELVILYLENAIYADNQYILKWVVAALFFSLMSTVPKIGLYAMGRDKVLIKAEFFTVLCFAGYCLLSSQPGIERVAFGLMAAFVASFVVKSALYFASYKEYFSLNGVANDQA